MFDAIVFGEREPGKWMAGSDCFRRTRDLAAAARSGEARRAGSHRHRLRRRRPHRRLPQRQAVRQAVHAGRRGCNAANVPRRRGRVLFGLRHTGAGNGFLAGEIEEARLYDRALTAGGGGRVVPGRRCARSRVEQLLARSDAGAAQQQRDGLLARIGQAPRRPARPLAAAAWPTRPNPTTARADLRAARGDVEKRATGGGRRPVGGEDAVARLRPAARRPRRRAPPEARRLDRQPRQPADGARDGQPRLALPFRPRHRRHAERLRLQRRTPLPSGTARLAGRRVHRPRLAASRSCTADLYSSSAPTGKSAASNAEGRGRSMPTTACCGVSRRGGWKAEAVRDAMLAVERPAESGHGRAEFPPVHRDGVQLELLQPDRRRRTRSTTAARSTASASIREDPLLESFDCPDPSVKTPRRSVTTTPLQALGLMNNAFVLRQAKYFAERVEARGRSRCEEAGAAGVPAGAWARSRRHAERSGRRP